jgi:hypothetical protein
VFRNLQHLSFTKMKWEKSYKKAKLLFPAEKNNSENVSGN